MSIITRIKTALRRWHLNDQRDALLADLRRARLEAERKRDQACYYEAEIIPALSLDLINVQRALQALDSPRSGPSSPILAQPCQRQNKPALRVVPDVLAQERV